MRKPPSVSINLLAACTHVGRVLRVLRNIERWTSWHLRRTVMRVWRYVAPWINASVFDDQRQGNRGQITPRAGWLCSCSVASCVAAWRSEAQHLLSEFHPSVCPSVCHVELSLNIVYGADLADQSQRRRTMDHGCWKSWVFSRRLKVLSDSSGMRS